MYNSGIVMHIVLCLFSSDVEKVVEKLYGSNPEPLILIGHRSVCSSFLVGIISIYVHLIKDFYQNISRLL